MQMASSLHHTFLILIITLFIGKGVGQWKSPEKIRKMIEEDLKLYKKISENIKQEIEVFHGDYPEGPINDYFLEEIDYVEHKIQKHRRKTKETENEEIHLPHARTAISKTNNHESTLDKPNDYLQVGRHRFSQEVSETKSKWPKFEDILLDIGKRYDWKNDRWIKVKEKHINEGNTEINVITPLNHQKHNFKYKIVKLNRAKSKRNIVIAVTAVR